MHQSNSFSNVRQYVSKCQYGVRCRGETNRFDGNEEQTLSAQSPADNSWWEPHEFCCESSELERAGAMEREAEAENIVSDFCISFAESALRMASTSGKKKVRKMTRVTSDSGFDVGELRRHVKDVEDRKHILMEKTKTSWEREVS